MKTHFVAPILVVIAMCWGLSATTAAQTASNEQIVVTGQELPSAYGAPDAFSQSRFAPLTNAYVLPPGEVYTSMIFEGDAVHFRPPDYHWTEECEIGLPWRINV